MRKLLSGLVVVSLALLLVAPALAQEVKLSGPHYTLNIHGVDKNKNPTMTNSDRHTIFVALGSKSKNVVTNIWLTNGYDFGVCDGNGFDAAYDCAGGVIRSSDGASFQLPCNTALAYTAGYGCPSEETTGIVSRSYTVWARALGKPGGMAKMTTCAYDDAGVLFCSISENVLTLSRVKSRPVWQDATNELTSLVQDVNGDGNLETVALFADGFEDFFWAYDNYGLRHAQIRFYPASK